MLDIIINNSDMGQALCKVLEAQVQALPKGLEAQFQALAKGLKHKHKHFLTEYIFPSFRYRIRVNVKSFIKFYCKYLLLHFMNISLKNVVSASRHLLGLNTFPAMLNSLSTGSDDSIYDM